MRPHLPIRGKPVKIDIASPTTKLIDEICVVGDKEGFRDCGLVFEPGHRVGRPVRFKLMTNCGTGDKSEKQDATYKLYYSFSDFNINRFWVNHPFPEIKVTFYFKFQHILFHVYDGRQLPFDISILMAEFFAVFIFLSIF